MSPCHRGLSRSKCVCITSLDFAIEQGVRKEMGEKRAAQDIVIRLDSEAVQIA